jgi:hypothetical protein
LPKSPADAQSAHAGELRYEILEVDSSAPERLLSPIQKEAGTILFIMKPSIASAGIHAQGLKLYSVEGYSQVFFAVTS